MALCLIIVNNTDIDSIHQSINPIGMRCDADVEICSSITNEILPMAQIDQSLLHFQDISIQKLNIKIIFALWIISLKLIFDD